MAKLTEKEVRFARSFLKYLGANQVNGYLLLAVIAWMRQESGQTYLGNNPFNIRKSPFASGYRQTRNGNGKFAIFANLDVAAKATVAFLKANAKFGNYGPIIAAARRATGKDGGVQQALDFLTAIAISKWDSAHYGAADGDLGKNHLIKVWATLTGTSIPKQWFVDPKPKPKPPPKPPFRQVVQRYHYPVPTADFIKPYAGKAFYEDRPHMGQFVLPADIARI